MKILLTRWFNLGFALTPLIVAAACTETNGGAVSFSLTARRAPAPPASAPFSSGLPAPSVLAAGDSTVITLGNDTVIVRSVELIVREVELKRVEVVDCDAVVGNEDCEEFETGPVLVSLPLGATNAEKVITVNAPPGMYDELEFEVHKPDAVEDAAFIATLPPGFPPDVSIRVQGDFVQGTGAGAGNRSSFDYRSDLNEKQEVALVPPLDVTEGAATNVTLRLDLSTWFLNAGRTALVDPASANKGQPNENVVRDNIRASIDAFRDDDEDGIDDVNEGS